MELARLRLILALLINLLGLLLRLGLLLIQWLI